MTLAFIMIDMAVLGSTAEVKIENFLVVCCCQRNNYTIKHILIQRRCYSGGRMGLSHTQNSVHGTLQWAS